MTERLCCRLGGIPPPQALLAALTDGTAHLTSEQLAALLKGCGEALASDAAHIGQRLSVWRGELGTLPPNASQDLQRCMDTLRALLEQAPSSTEWMDVAMTLGLALPSVPRAIRIELRAATNCSDPWLLLIQAVVTASDPANVDFIEATARSLCNDVPAWARDQMPYLPGAAPLAERAVSVPGGSGNAPLPSQQQELPPVPVTPAHMSPFKLGMCIHNDTQLYSALGWHIAPPPSLLKAGVHFAPARENHPPNGTTIWPTGYEH